MHDQGSGNRDDQRLNNPNNDAHSSDWLEEKVSKPANGEPGSDQWSEKNQRGHEKGKNRPRFPCPFVVGRVRRDALLQHLSARFLISQERVRPN